MYLCCQLTVYHGSVVYQWPQQDCRSLRLCQVFNPILNMMRLSLKLPNMLHNSAGKAQEYSGSREIGVSCYGTWESRGLSSKSGGDRELTNLGTVKSLTLKCSLHFALAIYRQAGLSVGRCAQAQDFERVQASGQIVQKNLNLLIDNEY